MTKRMLALAAAGLIAVSFAACGDSGDDSSSSETTAAAISEDDFVTQANEICATGNQELDSSEGPQGGDLESFVTDTFVPNIQGQIDAISALGAPEGQEDEVSQFLDDAQSALDAISDDPSSLGQDSFADVNQQAADLGLTECAG